MANAFSVINNYSREQIAAEPLTEDEKTHLHNLLKSEYETNNH